MSKNDEVFKKGCLEFLRKLSIIRPDLCSSVGGFKILINSLLDVNNYDIHDYILYSLLYIINSQTKRKYFNGFDFAVSAFWHLQASVLLMEMLKKCPASAGHNVVYSAAFPLSGGSPPFTFEQIQGLQKNMRDQPLPCQFFICLFYAR